MAGFQALNEEVEGTLEILKGGKVIEALEKEDNTLYYPDGYWEESVIFYQGEEAHAYYEKFTQAIKDVTLLFLKGKETLQRIVRVPYYVKQIPGPELGYEIMEFNPEEMPDKQATFEGYKLDLAPTLEKASYEINLERSEGEFFQGVKREVRLLKKENAQSLYIFSIFPLVVGAVVFVTRRRKLGS